MKKLGLLYGFCRWCPIVGWVESEDKKKAHLVVLPKPTKINLVEVGVTEGTISVPRYELHGDGEPSAYNPIANIYHWHNTRIPERMGIASSKEWEAEWLLDETNSEIRRILMQVIGYEKIAKNLKAWTVDTWREYSLIRFPQNIDVEPVQLLTMKCPTTGKLHALRVPPEETSARSAITWMNWDIDPEMFGRAA